LTSSALLFQISLDARAVARDVASELRAARAPAV
jgi:hypothetical protein